MSSLALDTQYVDKKYLGQIPEWIPKIEEAFHMLHEGTGA